MSSLIRQPDELTRIRNKYNRILEQRFHNQDLAETAFQAEDWEEYRARTLMAERCRTELLELDTKRHQLFQQQ